MINCLIVNDEPIARNGMLEYVDQVEFLHSVAVCKNAIKASLALQNNHVDLVFLDIQIQTIDNNEVILADFILPISKSYRALVMERVEKNLFKRL